MTRNRSNRDGNEINESLQMELKYLLFKNRAELKKEGMALAAHWNMGYIVYRIIYEGHPISSDNGLISQKLLL